MRKNERNEYNEWNEFISRNECVYFTECNEWVVLTS